MDSYLTQAHCKEDDGFMRKSVMITNIRVVVVVVVEKARGISLRSGAEACSCEWNHAACIAPHYCTCIRHAIFSTTAAQSGDCFSPQRILHYCDFDEARARYDVRFLLGPCQNPVQATL